MKLKHRITATILLIAFATTTALPAAGIPNLKNPPKAVSAPRVPAAIAAPRIPVVPKVNIPAAPKVPVVKVPAVKVPAAPRVPIVRTPLVPAVVSAPKIPTIKTPVVKTAAAPKTPVIKAPIVKTAVVAARVKVPAATKPAVTVAAAKIPVFSSAVSAKSADNQTAKRAVDSSSARQKKAGEKDDTKKTSDNKRVQFVMDQKAKQDAAKATQAEETPPPARKEKDFTGIEEAYRRMHESEEADRTGDDSKDPYTKNGGIDRDQLNKDERLIADFENDQLGTQVLLDNARKPKDPKEPATPEQDEDDDKTPVAVTKGRIKDLLDIEGTSQTTGLDGDEQEVVDAKDAIARGKVKDPRDVRRLVDKVANKGVDKQFGEAPEVDVPGLTRIGDALKKRGKFKEARDYYDQAIDALKNGGKNSAGYRLQVIAEVGHGVRPAKDLDRVLKPGGTPSQEPGTGSGGPAAAPAPATNPAPQDQAPAAAPVGQGIADKVPAKGQDKPASTPGAGPVGQGTASAGQNVDAGQPANTGTTDTASQNAASAGVTNQLGADTQNLGANSPQSPAASTPSANNDAAGNNEAPVASNPDATVSTPQDEVVLSTPGNDTDVVHTQSADGNTASDISYHADGTFTGTITTRDENGQIKTQTVSGTYSEGDDGQRHHTVTEASTPSTTNNNGDANSSQGQSQNGNSDGSGNGSNDDDDDDDKNNNSTDTPATTESEDAPADTAEANDDTAEASEEGTPNPEARERGGRSGRMAEATQGRVGGEEQRNQKKGLDQRKNGNGAGGPNPEDNSRSGVLLTAQEQKAFAKNLGMKSGGGVTTPADKDHSFAVTERDMKDIAARRGRTINPAGGGEGNGGSGQTLGKKGFAPGGSAPAPAPKGAQSSDIDGGEGGAEGSAPRTGSGTGGATGSIFGGTSGPGVSPVRAGAAAASSVRGANVRVNAAQMNNVQR